MSGTNLNLYFVQDDERPMHVLARDFGEAVQLWQLQLVRENPNDEMHNEQPKGVTLIAEGTDPDKMPEIILPRTTV